MEQQFDVWKGLIHECLGKCYVKRTQQLRLDLLSVDCGLKPAVLLDFTFPVVDVLYSFLKVLKERYLLESNLHVVTVDTDVIIVNLSVCSKPGVRGHAYTYSPTDLLFVDVSAGLPSPQIIPNGSAGLCITRKCFFEVMDRMNGSSCDKLEIRSFSVLDFEKSALSEEERSSINPSTLFGLFLGYPVVYYYNMLQDTQDNCLAMVSIVNFVVKGIVLNSGSQSQRAAPHMKCHTVFSFSIPELFVDGVTLKKIESWFEERKQVQGWRSIFSDLIFERTIVQLPKVCL